MQTERVRVRCGPNSSEKSALGMARFRPGAVPPELAGGPVPPGGKVTSSSRLMQLFAADAIIARYLGSPAMFHTML